MITNNPFFTTKQYFNSLLGIQTTFYSTTCNLYGIN